MEGQFSLPALLIYVCQASKSLVTWPAKWAVPFREGWLVSHRRLGLTWVSPAVCGLPTAICFIRPSEWLLGSVFLLHRLAICPPPLGVVVMESCCRLTSVLRLRG